MFLKLWILVAAFVAVAYTIAIEPLDLTAVEDQSQDVQIPEQHVREKRFLLAKKALLLGGAAGLGIGLAKGAFVAHHHPVYVYQAPSYPVYSYPVYPQAYPSYGYGGGGGWSGSQAYASAGASSW